MSCQYIFFVFSTVFKIMYESLIRVSSSLEIREGAIDRLVNLYKKSVYKTGVSSDEDS
jgi:hypothetical protein